MFKKIFDSLSMSLKQWGSNITIILFFISITVVGFFNVENLKEQMYTIGETQVPKTEIIGDLKEGVARIQLYTTRQALETNLEDKEKMENIVGQDIEEVRKNIKEIGKYENSAENKQILTDFNNDFETLAVMLPAFFEGSRNNYQDTVDKRLQDLQTVADKSEASLNKLDKNTQQDTVAAINDYEKTSANSVKVNIIVSIFAVLFSIICSYLITRIISRAIHKVDSNVLVTTKSVDIIDHSIDTSRISAQELEESMRKANESIVELAASIQKASGKTSDAATGVEEISSAMEQMSNSVNMVAQSANNVAVFADETSSAIEEMLASIEQVAGNTGNVGASVEQISAAIEEMSKSIKGVNEYAIDLTNSAENTSRAVEEMVASINQVAGSVKTVEVLSNNVKKDAHEGTQSLNETLNGMQEISRGNPPCKS